MPNRQRNLEDLSGKLAKYLSPQVYDSIFSGNVMGLSTSRKKLTVFFSDLENFTETTEGLQPEDLTYLLNNYFSEMSTIALEYGATIDKFIGDAMVMFFGDPETKGVKEDAQACVCMAIAMQRRMKDLQGIWKDGGYEKPFRMRIGLNTGYCTVGNFGSEQRMDYTIIGGEVNLGARLEKQADPDGILMSSETYALVRDLIEAEERPAIQVKGIRGEVRPFAVTKVLDDGGKIHVLRKQSDGLLIVLYKDKLTGKKHKQALADLQEA